MSALRAFLHANLGAGGKENPGGEFVLFTNGLSWNIRSMIIARLFCSMPERLKHDTFGSRL